MFIERIKLKNFRNYKEQEIFFNKNINIIYGNNAQGKTNILEAIFLCSMGKSFRSKKDKELIKFNEEKEIRYPLDTTDELWNFLQTDIKAYFKNAN